MRFIPIIFLLLWPSSASAQQICAAKIPALAKRLHVHPTSHPGLLIIDGCNGKNYDILDIINKLLDKMEQKAKR